ncbi:MAG: hypothetical protein A2V66_04330 [Ignavibacteria bacterium RBG_13_36_8]|nr:MAG: hypothetical protein A2V66_04330 [Ignavibacteria bacterium RBG_13_36_8]
MVSFSNLDILIIFIFFSLVLLIGFLSGRKLKDTTENYLLSGRNVGLFLFVLTNVATWYGGILGVGEFTYRYGLVSWLTQGLPYYIFAIIFAVSFAKKIRQASLYTIPDKLEQIYGKKVSLIASVLIFILVSPAPYLLMIGSLISLIFDINLFWALVISAVLSSAYLFKGGYKSDLYTDAFEFFVMFGGFTVIVITAISTYGGFEFLHENIPSKHLNLCGDVSPTFIIVWFLIALWTFTDPGFHQRCYAAKNSNVAVKGILISIIFWALFDFLTTATGLFARASIKEISNPVLSFPLLAENILGTGYKGIFYAALFATILSTLNSFFFISATTFGRDLVFKLKNKKDESKINQYTRYGLIITSIVSIILAYCFQSVVELWYMIGSICIPAVILLVIGSYYEKFRVSINVALLEIILALITSILWMLLRQKFTYTVIVKDIEPMIVGFATAGIIHAIYLLKRKIFFFNN